MIMIIVIIVIIVRINRGIELLGSQDRGLISFRVMIQKKEASVSWTLP